MSEQSPSQPQFNEQWNQLTSAEHMAMDGQRPPIQSEIDSAHEIALARDHHETNAAHALASMRVVEKAISEHPEDIGGQLQRELQTAVDSQVPTEVSTYERTRNISVARDARNVYSDQKQFEDQRGRDVRSSSYKPESDRARDAADFTVHKLRSSASNSMSEADNAERRMKHDS
jgi:hypothetical protein